MDKQEFIHKIKHLAVLKDAVKSRYPDLVIMGQVRALLQNRRLCTLHAVDIQLLVHSCLACRSLSCALVVGVCRQNFFENHRHWFTTTRRYTRIVVVVNAWHFLWISLFFLKKSWTCMLYKAVNDSVLACCQFWTNCAAVYKEDFVHNRYLWICRTLSTGACFCWQNLSFRNWVANLQHGFSCIVILVLQQRRCPGFFA